MSILKKNPLCWFGLLWIITCIATFVIGKRLAGTTENDQAVGEVDQQSNTRGRRDRSRTERNRSQASSPKGALSIAEEVQNIAARNSVFERSRSFLELAERLSSDQFAIALEALERTMTLGPNDASYRLMIEKWLETDYQAASEFLLEKRTFYSRERPEILLAYLARTNLQEAITLANKRSNLDPNQIRENFSPIIIEVAKNNLNEATRLLAEYIPSVWQRDIIREFIEQAMLNDRGREIVDWFSSLQDDSLKSEAKGAIAFGASMALSNDFELTRRVISTFDQEDQDELAGSIVYNWPTDDLDGVLQWVGAQSKEVQNEVELNLAVRVLSQRGPEEARRWLAKSESQTILYRVAKEVALYRSPADALDLVPVQRETFAMSRGVIDDIIKAWLREDPDAAKEYLLSRPDLSTL